MGREIKFRSWSKSYKQMIYVEQLDLMHDKLFGVLEGGKRVIQPTPIAKEVLMQFTGLHDKNGKEIWEGDIARRLDWYPKVQYTGNIYFDEGQFKLFGWGSESIYEMVIEVIGNIYEHPNLLKETTA